MLVQDWSHTHPHKLHQDICAKLTQHINFVRKTQFKNDINNVGLVVIEHPEEIPSWILITPLLGRTSSWKNTSFRLFSVTVFFWHMFNTKPAIDLVSYHDICEIPKHFKKKEEIAKGTGVQRVGQSQSCHSLNQLVDRGGFQLTLRNGDEGH